MHQNLFHPITIKGKKIILLFTSLVLLITALSAGNVKMLASRAGVSPLQPIKATTPNASIILYDEEYGFMMQHPLNGPNPWTNYFNVPFVPGSPTDREAYTNVVLRYDESRGHYHSSAWDIRIEYELKTWDGISSAATLYTGQSIAIDYDPATPYQDKALKRYANSFRSELKITAVYVNNVLQTGALAAAYSDVYLDVEQETERYYVLNKTQAPVVTATALTTTNELELHWNFVSGAESYDVEWIFVDHDDDPAPNLNTVNLYFDFRNATRINVPTQYYRIPLGYPKGILLYRVRPVGADVNDFGLRDDGKWSLIPTSQGNEWEGFTSTDAPSGTGDDAYRYNVSGMHLALNWQYAATYAEDGKRKEVVSFYDGSLHSRQTLTLNNTEGTAIVGETKYDYTGRAALTIMPTPVQSEGIRYYNNFNPNFDREDFDQDANAANPGTLSTTSGAGYYYSTANTSPLGFNGSQIPDAEGYAYSRVRYTTDGTDRPSSVSSPGAAHRPGGGHETKFYYGSPSSQDQVDRLFGNNAGERLHYQKNLVVDANGQSSVVYIDQYGRTVATALAGDEPESGALLPIDHRPAAQATTDNLLVGNNYMSGGAMISKTEELVVAENTVYNFTYDLSAAQSCEGCFTCKDCMYDLDIAIIDEFGNYVPYTNIISSCSTAVTGNPIRCIGISTGVYQFSVTLGVGKYQIIKTLTPSESSIATYRAEYIAFQRENYTCVAPQPINPASCDYSCESMCEQQYKSVDANGVTHYYDDNGLEITQAAGEALIQTCITSNCSQQQGPLNECEVKYTILLADVSPSGQYFENLPERFILDANGNLINNPNYDPNEWLTSVSTGNPSFWTNFNNFISGASPCSSLTITLATWADVRANWHDCFAEYLVQFHPEFCAYRYFCESTMCTKEGNPVYIEVSNSFDLGMYAANDYTTAVNNNYFNSVDLVQNTNYNLATDLTNGNESYQPFQQPVGPPTDPYFDCDPISSQCGTNSLVVQTEHLQKFYQMQNGNYLSIWYVMEDPGDIHLGNGNPDAPTLALFRLLHGDGTPNNIGLLADPTNPQPGQISRWTFYRSSYLYYKQLIIYSNFVGAGSCSFQTDSDQDGYTDVGNPITKGFQIRYPENPIYEMYTDDPQNMICTVNPTAQNNAYNTYVTTNNTTTCQQSCEDYATAWIAELNQTCTLTDQQELDIAYYLTEVCKLDCDGVNTMGGDGCSTCPGTPCAPATSCTGVQLIGNPSVIFYDFQDVITYFSNGACTEVVVHPPSADDADCHCQQLDYFIAQNFSGTPTDQEVADAINSAYNYSPGDYVTALQVNAWRTECSSATPSINDLNANNYPEELSCLDPFNVTPQYDASECACENVTYFINVMGYDKTDPTQLNMITAGFNAYLNPTIPFTSVQVQAWITECNQTTPNQQNLINNGLPLSLQCPVPVSTEQAAVNAAFLQAQCQSNNLIIALQSAVNAFENALEQAADEWEYEYRQNCLNSLAGREQFTMSHTANEYYYTLYYYDQAGNLVQTVPPVGVDLLTPTEITAVQNYRIPVGAPGYNPAYTPVYPQHTMVTRYKYNSLQQVTESSTPDGGLTTFWYDALGRPVLSQDARQYNYTPTKAYSYVEYDELGRVKESGEYFNTTPITWAISHDRDPNLSFLNWRNASTGKREVTYMYYDEEHNSSSATTAYGSGWQDNLRNRVSAVWYRKDPAVACSSGVDAATYYSYDIHGNVKMLVTETNINDRLYHLDENLKQTDYHYDLWSGNVNEVVYQQGEYDEFRHRYYYDADNRLISAYTSKNGIIWEKESKQFYYAHGPLARTEIGDRQVQGTDYAYTILGWTKGVNSNTLSPTRDIGKDGANTTGNLNKWFAYDAAAYSLGYFTNDYKAIDPTLNNTANSFLASETNDPTNSYKGDSYDLYNGNISRMVTVMRDASGNPIPVQGRTFRYDQLNRIKNVNAWTDANVVATNNWSTAATNNSDYHEEFTFDMNGNIETAIRNGNLTGTHQYMDNITYLYNSGTNKLDYVNDLGLALSTDYDMDIDGGQTPGNYQYDAIGNLTKDVSEEIDNIEWNSWGKITKITRTNTSNKDDLEFLYDASGQRIAKIVKPRANGVLRTEEWWTYTVYSRDVSGIVLAVYKFDYKTMSGNNNYRMQYDLKELHVYGGARLGIRYDQQAEVTRDFTLAVGGYGTFDFYSNPTCWIPNTLQKPTVSTTEFKRELGYKSYELTNHLGNVLATISDRRIPVGSSGNISNFLPEIMTYTDYYVFGSPMPGRNASASSYRYGFSGKEKDDEINGSSGTDYDFGARIYDARLGRWLSTDPMSGKYPSHSPYNYALDNPVYFVDPDGADVEPFAMHYSWMGIEWYSYPGFDYDPDGAAFFSTWSSLYASNRSFRSIYSQLESSSNIYRVQSNRDMGSQEYGDFDPNHTGTTEDPFTITFQVTTNIAGHTNTSTIYEEFAHAGQNDYYSKKGTSQTWLQTEVEAKVMKAVSGVEGNGQYEKDFYNNPAVAVYRDKVAKGEQITAGEQANFELAVIDFAAAVYKVYTENDPARKDTADPNTYDPGADGSLDYFKEVVKPKEPAAVVVDGE